MISEPDVSKGLLIAQAFAPQSRQAIQEFHAAVVQPDAAKLAPANEKALLAEIERLNQVVNALKDRGEGSTSAQCSSEFSLFQATILLEEQVHRRTAELEQALCENERIKRALRSCEATFRGVLSQSLVGIVTIENGVFRYANSKFCEIFGYSPEELLALGPLDIAADSDREIVAQKMHDPLRGEAGHVEYMFRGLRKNRAEIDVECHSSVIDVGGRLVQTTLVIDVTEKIQAMRTLQELKDQLREQAMLDPLTGLYNRLPLHVFLDRELSLAKRLGYPIAAILADLDHFETLNETYGHLAGDEVLRTLAGLMKKHCRAGDICCRYGGEQFLMVLPHLPGEEAAKRANEIRAIVAEHSFVLGESVIKVTASFGVASVPQHGHTRETLLGAADSALYQAKNAGRNRVKLFSKTLPAHRPSSPFAVLSSS